MHHPPTFADTMPTAHEPLAFDAAASSFWPKWGRLAIIAAATLILCSCRSAPRPVVHNEPQLTLSNPATGAGDESQVAYETELPEDSSQPILTPRIRSLLPAW
jgi:hypothetical protein